MQHFVDLIAPWYMQIKFVHLSAVMAWIWSTSVAYLYYLLPAIRAWRRQPDDPAALKLRNWAMDRFDAGAQLEHIAFVVLLLSGALLYLCGGWTLSSGWMLLKLLIVLGLFLPIELLDIHLAHLGGNKQRVRNQQGDNAAEQAIQQHWKFLLLSTPVIIFYVSVVVYLAVVKPL